MYRTDLDSLLLESIAGVFGCRPCRAAIRKKLFSVDFQDVLYAADMCIEHNMSIGDRGEIETYRKPSSLQDDIRYAVFSYLWFLEHIQMPNTLGEHELLCAER